MKYKIGDYVCFRGMQGVCKVAGINADRYDLSVMGNRNGKMYDDGGCMAHLWGIVEENLRDYVPDNETVPIEEIKRRIIKTAERQAEWKHEGIDKAINTLTEDTHRCRDNACKILLKHFQNMPIIQSWDIGVESDELPF